MRHGDAVAGRGTSPAVPSPSARAPRSGARSNQRLRGRHAAHPAPSHRARPRRCRDPGARAGHRPAGHDPPRPHRREAPARDEHPRLHPHRRLLLAAREEQSRGAAVPRGGECVHRRCHEANRGASAADLRRHAPSHQANGSDRALSRGRVCLLLAHRGGEAVLDPLPQERERWRGRGAPRPKRAREGARLLRPRRRRGEQRRQPPRLHLGQHRLPAVHAAHKGPSHRTDPPGPRSPHRERCLVGGRPHATAHHRGLRHQAQRQFLAARRRHERQHTHLSRARRAVRRLRLSLREPPDDLPRVVREDDDRGALPPGRSSRRAPHRRAAEGEGSRVRRGLRRGTLLHSHQQGREELPSRLGARRGAGAVDRGHRARPAGQTR